MIINKTGLTFAGKVWRKGELVNPEMDGFPTHLIDSEWFVKQEAVKVDNEPEEDEEKPQVYVCETCGKEYKRKDFYDRHIESCK